MSLYTIKVIALTLVLRMCWHCKQHVLQTIAFLFLLYKYDTTLLQLYVKVMQIYTHNYVTILNMCYV